MAFDLDTLKDKLPSETLDKLRAHVDELSTRVETAEEKARTAAKESISGRKTLKAERDAAFDKLGVSTLEELEALPDGKGQADAVKQMQTKLTKTERERDEAIKAHEEVGGKLKGLQRQQQMRAATEGLGFKHPDDVLALAERRIVEEGDELLFLTDDNKRVPLKDGFAWFAKTRPDYVKPSGNDTTGSGFGTSKPGSGGKPATAPVRKDYPDEVSYFRAAAAFTRDQREAATN